MPRPDAGLEAYIRPASTPQGSTATQGYIRHPDLMSEAEKLDRIRDIVGSADGSWERARQAESRARRFEFAARHGVPVRFVETEVAFADFLQALMRHPKAVDYLPSGPQGA